MPRPKSKSELIQLSGKNFAELNQFIEGLSPEEQLRNFPEGTMNRNIRDILCHLHEWHRMFLKWYATGMAGVKPIMPAEGYTWKTSSALNHKIWEDYQETSLDTAKNMLNETHDKVFKLIEKHSEEELFEKKRYAWTGSTSLAAYLISATSSHYDWGLKLIRKAIKQRRTN